VAEKIVFISFDVSRGEHMGLHILRFAEGGSRSLEVRRLCAMLPDLALNAGLGEVSMAAYILPILGYY